MAIVLTSAMCNNTPKDQAGEDLKTLEWILGTWQRTNVQPGTTAYEAWRKESEQVYTGLGWSMKGSDTSFVEKLRIEIKEGKPYYVADVRENAEPVYFLMSELSSTGFKSENPEHDFPKVITYSLEGSQMTAVISDGGDKKMGFVFKKQ